MVRLSESCGKNFEVIAKRLAYCDEWDSEEDFAGTSPASATTSNARWAALPAASTTKLFGRVLFLYDYLMAANGNMLRTVCPLTLSPSRAFPKGKALLHYLKSSI